MCTAIAISTAAGSEKIRHTRRARHKHLPNAPDDSHMHMFLIYFFAMSFEKQQQQRHQT